VTVGKIDLKMWADLHVFNARGYEEVVFESRGFSDGPENKLDDFPVKTAPTTLIKHQCGDHGPR
jgi:hypothetical protein